MWRHRGAAAKYRRADSSNERVRALSGHAQGALTRRGGLDSGQHGVGATTMVLPPAFPVVVVSIMVRHIDIRGRYTAGVLNIVMLRKVIMLVVVF